MSKGKRVFECPECHRPLLGSVCPHCGPVIRGYGRNQEIPVQGTNAKEVQEVSLALMGKAKSPRTLPNPWVSGSFYLAVFLVVAVTLSIAGHLLPVYILPIVLIGNILALSIVGAFQLRQDKRLNEDNFLKLMALSFRYLPWIRQQRTKRDQSSMTSGYNNFGVNIGPNANLKKSRLAGRDYNEINGSLDFRAVHNSEGLPTELEKLKEEVEAAGRRGILDQETTTDVEYQVTKALQQAKRTDANKELILEHLIKAKSLIYGITAASNLVTTVMEAIEAVDKLF